MHRSAFTQFDVIVSVGIADEQRCHVVIIYWYTLKCVLGTGAQTSVPQSGSSYFQTQGLFHYRQDSDIMPYEWNALNIMCYTNIVDIYYHMALLYLTSAVS